MFNPFSCAILWLKVVMPPKRRRSTGPPRASVVEVLTPRDPFVNRQRISCKIPWYSAKGNPTMANDIVVPTTSAKVMVTGCLHHHFHTSSQQLLNSTSSDTDVLWPPPPITTGYFVRCVNKYDCCERLLHKQCCCAK